MVIIIIIGFTIFILSQINHSLFLSTNWFIETNEAET